MKRGRPKTPPDKLMSQVISARFTEAQAAALVKAAAASGKYVCQFIHEAVIAKLKEGKTT